MNNSEYEFMPISKSDNEVFRTIALLSKLSINKENTRQMLRDGAESANADYTYKLSFALFNLCANDSKDVLESKTNVEDALNMFEQILDDNPNNWLAKIYKIRIQLMLPSSFRDEEEIVEELNEIIENQKYGEFRPYYVIPYLLMAQFYWSEGESANAIKYIEMAKELHPAHIKDIVDYLIIMFEDLEHKLLSSGELEAAKDVLELKSQYFA